MVSVWLRVKPASVALMVTCPVLEALVSITKVTVELPAGTVTLLLEEPLLSKTARLPLLVLRLMPTFPSAVAASVTVPVTCVPRVTEFVLSVNEISAGVRVSTVDFVPPLKEDEIVTLEFEATKPVSMRNEALVAPAPMVTLLLEEPLLSKTARLPLLVLRLMPTPPGGAGAFRVTVPVDCWQPPTTVVG